MPKFRSDGSQEQMAGRDGHGVLAITEGEVNFLWSFIQGSLANLETWGRLLDSYGFCERHAWIHLSIEMTFREQYLLGPTILYAALIEKALHAVRAPWVNRYFVEQKLRAGDACLLCTLNITNASRGASPQPRLSQGYDTRSLQTFAAGLKQHWQSYVCDACRHGDDGKSGKNRCRRHLIADMRARRPVDLLWQQEMLHGLHDRVVRCQESFLAGKPKANDDERASLIDAIGWCSGWRPLLDLLQHARPDTGLALTRGLHDE